MLPTATTTATPDLEGAFRDHSPALRSYLANRVGLGADSEDLLQETFLQFARKGASAESARNLRPFLFGIARKLCLAFWRRRKFEPLDESHEQIAPAAAAPDERAQWAREIIAELPPLQREILDLRFQRQLSCAEIAEALAIPVGTVRSRLHHSVHKLRAALVDDNPENSGP